MTATARAYRTPYVSQMLQEPDRTWDDCCASVTIMLANDWTLGEWYIRDDGRSRDVHVLRNTIRKRIGITDGGLTLHDSNDMMHELDPDLPPLPRYGGQALKPGQTLPPSAMLRLTWDELKDMLRKGHSAALCGLSGTVGHVIHVTDGDATGALVKDPLTRKGENWPGERWTWEKLHRFTSANDWQYGSPTAIACAVVKVGDETEAARMTTIGAKTAARLLDKLQSCKAQTALATEERDAARAEAKLATKAADELRAELVTTKVALNACQNATPTDCTAALAAQRASLLAAVRNGVGALVDGLEAEG